METYKDRLINCAPVLIVDLSKWYGGVDTRVFETAMAMHGRFPYAVLTIQGSEIYKRLKKANLITIPLPFNRADPRILFSIMRIIQENGYKVIDTHNPQSQFWGGLAARMTNIPLIITTVHSSYRESYKGLKCLLYECILRLNNLWKSQFVVVSESVSKYLKSVNIKEDHISLIYNGIRLPERNQKEKRSSLLDRLGWDNDNFIVTVVGRLEPEKGHKYLIEALSDVVKNRSKVRCLIIGEGRLQKELELQVKRNGLKKWVYFTSFRNDIIKLLSSSNAFCMPSLTEGLPFSLLEACICRLPLIVTKVGGLKDLLTDNKTAIMVPPRDSRAISEAIINLIDNPQENSRLGNAAFELACSKFSNENMINKTLAIYKSINKLAVQ